MTGLESSGASLARLELSDLETGIKRGKLQSAAIVFCDRSKPVGGQPTAFGLDNIGIIEETKIVGGGDRGVNPEWKGRAVVVAIWRDDIGFHDKLGRGIKKERESR